MRSIVGRILTVVAAVLLAAGCGTDQGTGLLALTISADNTIPGAAASSVVLTGPGKINRTYPGAFPPVGGTPLVLEFPNLPASDSPVAITVQAFDSSHCLVGATTKQVTIKGGVKTTSDIVLSKATAACGDGGGSAASSDGGAALDGAGNGFDGTTIGVDGAGSTGTEAGVALADGSTLDTPTIDGTKDAPQTSSDEAGSIPDGADAINPARPEVTDTPLGSEAGPDTPLGSGGTTGTGGITGSGGGTGTGGTSSGGTAAGGAGMGGAGMGGVVGTGGIAGTGGVVGTGGIVGTGGVVGMGGIVGTGGVVGTGGTFGSGGISGTGGTSSVACSPACTADQDCVSGSCVVLPWGGMTCSSTADCPSYATCCSGADQTCDGTKLPAGDGTNAGEFVVSADSLTVTDTITGLVWQRDGSGTRTGCTAGTTCTWVEAQAYCAALVLGGVSGWRLPARMELLTIVDFTLRSPSTDRTTFPNTPSEQFWTSSPYLSASGYAWVVFFSEGDSISYDMSFRSRVRCVR